MSCSSELVFSSLQSKERTGPQGDILRRLLKRSFSSFLVATYYSIAYRKVVKYQTSFLTNLHL